MNQNYPYMNPYNFNPYQQRYVPPVPAVQTGIAGKIVQSVEQVVANDVPMDGSVAVFPKQDMTEIYVKNWCADGTIRTLTYRPVQQDAPKEVQADTNKMDSGVSQNVTEVFEQRFDELVGKIDKLEQALLKKRSPVTKKEEVE